MGTSRSLRIVIIDADYARNSQREEYTETASAIIALRLARLGYTVTILSAQPSEKISSTLQKVRIECIGLHTRWERINRTSFFLTLPLKVKSIKADIILEYFSSSVSPQITPCMTTVPVIGIPNIFSGELPQHRLTALLFPLERLRLRLYHHIIGYTSDIALFMQQVNPRVNVRHIPYLIGDEYLAVKNQPAEYILFLGNLNSTKKGLDLLLKAYAKIAKKVAYPLVIAGHGKDAKKVRKLISQLRLDKKVKMVGPTYGDKKLSLLTKAVLLAYPARYDDVPVVAIEGIAAGLPIVAFDIPALSWTEESFCLKAVPYDIDDFSRLLKYAAKSADRDVMQDKTKAFARKFTSDRIIKAYEKFFMEIVNKKATK